jgi:hypothetical protein
MHIGNKLCEGRQLTSLNSGELAVPADTYVDGHRPIIGAVIGG